MNTIIHGSSVKQAITSFVLVVSLLLTVSGIDTWAYSIEHHLHHLTSPTANDSTSSSSQFNHITNYLQSIDIPFAVSDTHTTDRTNQDSNSISHIYSHIATGSTKNLVIITDLDPANVDTISILLYLTSILKSQSIPINIFVLYLFPDHNNYQYINNGYADFLSKTSLILAHHVLLLDSTADSDSMQINIGATSIPSYSFLQNILAQIPETTPYAFPSFWRSGTRINLTSPNQTAIRPSASFIQQQHSVDFDVDVVHISLPTLYTSTNYGDESFDEFISRYHYATYLRSVFESLAGTPVINDIKYIAIPFASETNLINDTNIVGIITVLLFAIIVMVSVRSNTKRTQYLLLLYKSIDSFSIFALAVIGSLLVSSYLLHLFIAQAQIADIVFEHAIWFFALLLCIWYWIGCATTYLLFGTIRITSGRSYGVYALVVSCVSALCFTIINAYFAIIALFIVVGISAVLNIKSIHLKRNVYTGVLLLVAAVASWLLIVSGNDLAYTLITPAIRTNIVLALFVLPLYFYNNRLLTAGGSLFQLVTVKLLLVAATLGVCGRIAYILL